MSKVTLSIAPRLAKAVLPKVLVGLVAGGFAASGFAADSKPGASQESRQSLGGLEIESVIDGDKAPTLELLQEGFVIECSGRFESGCKLFLKP